MEHTSETLYKVAYGAHYNDKDYDSAISLYNEVIEKFPDAKEAQWASQQLKNIPSKSERAALQNAAKKFEEQAQASLENESKIGAQSLGSFADAQGKNLFWISFTNIVTWVNFVGILAGGIICGSIIAAENPSIGISIIVGSIIAAFLSIPMRIMLANAAREVSEIKEMLNKKS